MKTTKNNTTSNVNANNASANANTTNAAPQAVTFDSKRVKKGVRETIKVCSTLNQVCKQLSGMYAQKLEAFDAQKTVEQLLAHLGVVRPKAKGGKKQDLRPQDFCNAWDARQKTAEGTLRVFANRPVIWVAPEGCAFADAGEKLRVYEEKQANKVLKGKIAKALSVYEQKAIAQDAWTIRTLLTGLHQSSEYEKHAEKASKSADAVNKVKKYFVVSDGKKYEIEL